MWRFTLKKEKCRATYRSIPEERLPGDHGSGHLDYNKIKTAKRCRSGENVKVESQKIERISAE
jgi:hypothetical protein